jgi:hypothetical protein
MRPGMAAVLASTSVPSTIRSTGRIGTVGSGTAYIARANRSHSWHPSATPAGTPITTPMTAVTVCAVRRRGRVHDRVDPHAAGAGSCLAIPPADLPVPPGPPARSPLLPRAAGRPVADDGRGSCVRWLRWGTLSRAWCPEADVNERPSCRRSDLQNDTSRVVDPVSAGIRQPPAGQARGCAVAHYDCAAGRR